MPPAEMVSADYAGTAADEGPKRATMRRTERAVTSSKKQAVQEDWFLFFSQPKEQQELPAT